MTPAPPPRTGTGAYRALLGRLDAWFESARKKHGTVIPCRAGCSACCHGPFDITVADVELLREGLAALDGPERIEVEARATGLLEAMQTVEPEWTAPHPVAGLGEDRFDALIERFADVPCPLLDDAGRCRIYHARPLVCRLIGLGLATLVGRVIENACPIQERFPLYAGLAPEPNYQGIASGMMGNLFYINCLSVARSETQNTARSDGTGDVASGTDVRRIRTLRNLPKLSISAGSDRGAVRGYRAPFACLQA